MQKKKNNGFKGIAIETTQNETHRKYNFFKKHIEHQWAEEQLQVDSYMCNWSPKNEGRGTKVIEKIEAKVF